MKHAPRPVRHLARALLVAAGPLVLPAPALAQTPATEPKADEAAAASSVEPSDEQREEVRARFMRGVELYEESEFKLALIEFERAYSIVPSYHILYNIGQVQQQLGRFAKALQTLERYLAEGGGKIPDARRQAVEKDLATLRARTALLTVVMTEPGANVVLDGASLGRSPVGPKQLVDAGEHQLVVDKPGFVTHRQTLVLAGGDDVETQVALVREQPGAQAVAAPQAAPRSAAPTWVAWATTGLLAAGATTTGVLALGAASDLDDMRARVTTEDERRATQSRGETLAWVTNGLAAGALVAGGVALYLTLKRPAHEPAKVGAGAGGLTLRF